MTARYGFILQVKFTFYLSGREACHSCRVTSQVRHRVKVEQKKELIEQLKHSQSFTNEEKLKLLQNVIVSDFELEYHFTRPNYDDEVQVFNDIFKENPIESSLEAMPMGITVKRNRNYVSAMRHLSYSEDSLFL